ncbi:MAG TPA: SURF1 family protein [Rhizomicrobium sp.]|jgi:surfeit locus 1 family protein|nr:SURF1 family protein [Rhizomicrobium sp.]
MPLYFRPLWTLTIAAAVAFACLVALGVWQLDRLQWKLALIAEVNRNMAAPPVSAAQALAMGAGAEYRRVALEGRFDNSKEAYIFGTDARGGAVYHVVVPFLTARGRWFLVDRGVVPKEKLDPATRRAGRIVGPTRVVGVWRTPEGPGLFTPSPDFAHRIWYAHDLGAIAKADGVALAAPVVIEADATPNPGGWPSGGRTVVRFRNEHLQYAITWFGLAAVLIGVYLAYHLSRGRLGFRR